MAIINGTELKVYSASTTNLVAYAQNCTLNVNHSPREITNKESAGFKEILEGLRDFSIDIDGAYAWTSDAAGATPLPNGVDDVLETNILNVRQPVTFIFGDIVKILTAGLIAEISFADLPELEKTITALTLGL